MKKTKLEYRMYGFVLYSLSGIQKGIQFGHAVVEYISQYGKEASCKAWVKKDKTFVILSGGTSNDGSFSKNQSIGDMQQLDIELRRINRVSNDKVSFSRFYEPDCNNALTAICFLVDERVYDYEKYPDFLTVAGRCSTISAKELIDFKNDNASPCMLRLFEKWKIGVLGGELNYQLRELLKGKRLA